MSKLTVFESLSLDNQTTYSQNFDVYLQELKITDFYLKKSTEKYLKLPKICSKNLKIENFRLILPKGGHVAVY